LYALATNDDQFAERSNSLNADMSLLVAPPSIKTRLTSPWVVGLCHVVFDIDEGQKVSFCVPEGCLTDSEKNDVAFHCFPVRLSMQQAASTLALHGPYESSMLFGFL